VIDRALGASPYFAGDEVSLADLFLAPIVAYVAEMPEGDALMSACPNLSRWLEAIAKRPSFTATLPPRLAPTS
jgi:glutathione S-transferase